MTAIMAREIRDAVRSRWFVATTAVFCVLALGISYLGFSGANALGFAGFNRTVGSLLNLMLLFVPLMGLLVGALGLSGEKEDGTLGYLLAQPVGRFAVFSAKFLGQASSLTFAVAAGLGMAGLVIAWEAGAGGAAAFGILALDSILLGSACLSLGVLAAVVTSSRMRALSVALLLWVFFAFVADAAPVVLAVTGHASPAGLFFLSLTNPVQLAKVLCLIPLSEKLEILGPAGVYAVKTFGSAGAAAISGVGLAAWTLFPAAVAAWKFRRMNVR